MAEDSIEPTEVRDAQNFLFERRQFISRPFAFKFTPTVITGNIRFGRSLFLDTGPVSFILMSNGKIYKLVGAPTNAAITATEITGAGTSFDNVIYHNAEAVNGVILIANNTTGMIRWDTSGTVYTIVANSNYRYVTSHLNRAIGAYKLDGAAGDARRIGGSQSGDETLWTGLDSFNTNLVDSPDDITALEVIHDILVVGRRQGFHIGLATGLSQPVYAFKTWGRNLSGVYYPQTVDSHNNVMYYVSQEDVYSFDLQKLTPIGANIRKELMRYLQLGVNYIGFVSHSAGLSFRLRYNLVPVVEGVEYPHFSYDIKDETWSKHTYAFLQQGGFTYLLNQTYESIAILDNVNNIYLWTPEVACEMPQFFKGRVITIGAEEVDATVHRLLVKYRNTGVTEVTLKLRCMLNSQPVEKSKVINLGTDTSDQELYRAWVDLGLVGQHFLITLEVPANSRLEGNYIGLQHAAAGEYKGDTGF